MKDFVNKIDNDPTSAGVVVAEEYNSAFNELKNAVKPYIPLDEQNDKQLSESIDIASKAFYYGDVGSVNNVVLTRTATSDPIETLFDGMVIVFTAANENTGASTLKLNELDTKAMLHNGSPLEAGVLRIGVKYIAIYSMSADSFNIDSLAGIELPLGVGQTWQNKTNERTTETVYTNDTGRAIYVVINAESGSSTDSLNVNGSIFVESTTTDDHELYSIILPSYNTIELNSGTLLKWWELT